MQISIKRIWKERNFSMPCHHFFLKIWHNPVITSQIKCNFRMVLWTRLRPPVSRFPVFEDCKVSAVVVVICVDLHCLFVFCGTCLFCANIYLSSLMWFCARLPGSFSQNLPKFWMWVVVSKVYVLLGQAYFIHLRLISARHWLAMGLIQYIYKLL